MLRSTKIVNGKTDGQTNTPTENRTPMVGNHMTLCTYIRTERIRKLVIIYLILINFHEVKCRYLVVSAASR